MYRSPSIEEYSILETPAEELGVSLATIATQDMLWMILINDTDRNLRTLNLTNTQYEKTSRPFLWDEMLVWYDDLHALDTQRTHLYSPIDFSVKKPLFRLQKDILLPSSLDISRYSFPSNNAFALYLWKNLADTPDILLN